MKTPAIEREQALRWLIANRRPDVSIEQAVRVMCTALPRDLAEVIDVCKRATNWAEIRAEHFPMHGFHS